VMWGGECGGPLIWKRACGRAAEEVTRGRGCLGIAVRPSTLEGSTWRKEARDMAYLGGNGHDGEGRKEVIPNE